MEFHTEWHLTFLHSQRKRHLYSNDPDYRPQQARQTPARVLLDRNSSVVMSAHAAAALKWGIHGAGSMRSIWSGLQHHKLHFPLCVCEDEAPSCHRRLCGGVTHNHTLLFFPFFSCSLFFCQTSWSKYWIKVRLCADIWNRSSKIDWLKSE